VGGLRISRSRGARDSAPVVPPKKPEELDVTSDPLGPPPSPKLEKTEIAKAREVARRRIAYGLLALLSVVCLALLLAEFAGWVKLDEDKDLATVILSPIVVLVGTALGFYFGGNSS